MEKYVVVNTKGEYLCVEESGFASYTTDINLASVHDADDVALASDQRLMKVQVFITIVPAAEEALEIVEHKTARDKIIRGVVRKDVSASQAKAIDPYTFPKDGGYFIREKYLAA
jgi:nitrogen fixation/metabolism regulation signal transduction histidine kinase